MRRFVFLVLCLAACTRESVQRPKPVVLGNPARGKEAIDRYGCGACHQIPGISGPKGMVGPSLAHIATRPMIARKIPNNPQTLSKWLQDPLALDPQTSMPNLGVTAADSRDITAYLETLR